MGRGFLLRICMLQVIAGRLGSARALSSTQETMSGWSRTAVESAHRLSIQQRKKLEKELGDGLPMSNQPGRVKILVERAIDGEERSGNDEADGSTTKILHLQRHGQGYHNLLGDVLRDAGIRPDIDSTDPKVNPWIRPEIVDSPFTEQGIGECKARKDQASTLTPQVVIVSPLTRAIQTAEISFAAHRRPEIPWIAHEGCREELGMLICNQRRPVSSIQTDFSYVDFSLLEDEQDILFDTARREGPARLSERIYDFMVNFVAGREEDDIAIVGHSAWLFHMLNAVADCKGDSSLASWFLTSEIRTVKVTFVRPT